MKIVLTEHQGNIIIGKDYTGMENGLIGQTIAELLIVIDELKKEYDKRGDKKEFDV